MIYFNFLQDPARIYKKWIPVKFAQTLGNDWGEMGYTSLGPHFCIRNMGKTAKKMMFF